MGNRRRRFGRTLYGLVLSPDGDTLFLVNYFLMADHPPRILFVLAPATYAYAAFYNYGKPTNAFDVAMMFGSAILCPPQLVFVMCIDCEVIGWNGFIMYAIIGVLNAALYAIIGYVVSNFRKQHNARNPGSDCPS